MSSQQRGTERLQFLEGSLLAGKDLRDDVAYESRMRGLHVRVLHNTWGVARGFETFRSQARDAMLISPGIAYDCAGREIISSRTLVVPLPPKREMWESENGLAWFDLVISWDFALNQCRPDRAATCIGEGPSPNEERARWRWEFAGTSDNDATLPELAQGVRFGEDIPLARVGLNVRWNIDVLSFESRRHAKALVRPHFGTGYLEQGSAMAEGGVFHWSVFVDTSAAGFTTTPYYFARLDGILLDQLRMAAGGSDQVTALVQRLLGPFISIESPKPDGFTLSVRMALSLTNENSEFFFSIPSTTQVTIGMVDHQARLPLPDGVHWYGVEPVEGCPPAIALNNLMWSSGMAFSNPSIAFSNLITYGFVTTSSHRGDAQS